MNRYAPAIASLLSVISFEALANNAMPCAGRSYESPPGIEVVCSMTWMLQSSACNGTDLWESWKVTGAVPSKDHFIRPWVEEPILVIGYEMVKVDGPPHMYLGIGSGIQPDMMLWMGANETRAANFFPGGARQPWPSVEEAKNPGLNNIIDVHGVCNATPEKPLLTIMVTVYYTPWPKAR